MSYLLLWPFERASTRNRRRLSPGNGSRAVAAFSLGFLLDMASVASINPSAWLKFG
jgi:hypothetical protein